MRKLLGFTILGLAAGAVLVACGGDDSGGSSNGDASVPSDAASDGSQPRPDGSFADAALDAGEDGSEDATPSTSMDAAPVPQGWDASCVAPPDAGPLGEDDGGDAGGPLGRLLLPGKGLCVYGFTANNDVIYADVSGNLGIVPWTGGCAESISTSFDIDSYVTSVLLFSNQALFFWDNDGFEAWTKVGGKLPLADTGGVIFPNTPSAAASPDSTWLAFAFETSAGWNIVIAKSDGTVRMPLVTGASCNITLQFSSAGDLYAQYCPSGATTATLSRFTAGTWVQTDVADGLVDNTTQASTDLPALLDPTTSWAWLEAAAAPQHNSLFQGATGATTLVDVAGGPALFDPAGTQLFYVTPTGLRRSTTTSPSPTTLTSSAEAAAPLALSPDGQRLLVRNASGALRTVTTSAPSTPVTISTDVGYLALENDSFTADSKYVLYYDAFQGSFEPDGTFHGVPVDGSGPGISLVGKQGSFAISGSLVAVADVSTPTATSGDVNLVDVSGVAPTRLIAPGAWVTSGDPCGWLATPDRKNLVYSRSNEGLYVAPTQ